MRQVWVFGILFLLIAGLATAADCTLYSYTDKTDGGSDYFGVNTVTTNSSAVTADQVFTNYIFFTPRLNFTATIGETIGGGSNGTTYSLHWNMNGTSFTTVNDTFTLKNGSTTIPRTNYTLGTSDNKSYYVTWIDPRYVGNTNISATWNRTFVKNVDDLVTGPGLINSDAPFTNSWLDITKTLVYGDSATFKFDDYLPYGAMINNSNWAVGWSYTERTCLSTQADAGTYDGIRNTKNIAFAAFALLAVMILAMIAWGIISVINGGNADLTVIAVLAIGGGVVLFIAYYIIYFIATALGA